MLGADNQQGSSDRDLCNYIAGFVDGEGSFHVAIQRSAFVSLGWQVIPEFHVSQHESSRNVLELIQRVLGCGNLKPNHRHNPKDKTWVLVVRSRKDLLNKVIPFFEKFKLRTVKRANFEKFAEIVREMTVGAHLESAGLVKILERAFSMNANGSYRKINLANIIKDLNPSETVRRIANI